MDGVGSGARASKKERDRHRESGTDETFPVTVFNSGENTSRLEAVKKLGESESIMLLRSAEMSVHCRCDERSKCFYSALSVD